MKFGKKLVTEAELVSEASPESFGRFVETDEDVNKFIQTELNKLPFNVTFCYITDHKLKKYIEIKKNNDLMQFLTKAEMLCYVNEEIHDELDQESREILIEQEMSKVSVDIASGKIKMDKPDISTFKGIVDKWSLDKVNRANHLVELIRTQKENED